MKRSVYSGSSPQTPKSPLLQSVQRLARTLHLSIRTEKAYLAWIEDFLRFHRNLSGRWRHPSELDSAAVNQYLTHLAVDRHVAASTQNQALSAILFLYRRVLDLPVTFDAVRAKKPQRLPVVLSVDEVRRLLHEIPPGPILLIAGLGSAEK